MRKNILSILLSFVLITSISKAQTIDINQFKDQKPLTESSSKSIDIKKKNKQTSSQTVKGPVNFNNHFTTEKCGFSINLEQQKAADPTFVDKILQSEKALQQLIQNKATSRRAGVLTIPVVVHIIHDGDALNTGSNISDAQIQSAIDNINDAFRKVNTAFTTYTGVDTQIEFCLAQRDPSNNPHTGINRIDGSALSATYAANGIYKQSSGETAATVKGWSFWPTTDYYNVWVVSKIDGSDGSGIQGYASLPVGLPYDTDGAVMLYNSFGYDPDGSLGYQLKSYTNRNVTFIHESGHYLNLYHTFEGDNNGASCPTNTSCTTDGDFCCDTPPHIRSNSDCLTSGTNSCDGGSSNSLFVHNFMDYSSDACQTEFTQDQADRMYATIDVGGPRAALTSSIGCNPVYTLDAGIASVSQPNGAYCGNSVYPIVELTNYGSTTLTSATITYNIDGGTNETYSWSGSLTNAQSESVSLSSITATAGTHTFYATVSSPNAGTDEYAANDDVSASFTMTVGNGLNLYIEPDAYGSECTWVLLDGSSLVVDQGGPYTDVCPQVVVDNDYCLANDCYTVSITDSFGDGFGATDCGAVGSYSITESTGTNHGSGSGDFGTEAVHNFCLAPPSAGDDAGITTINNPADGSSICSTTITPVVTLKNYGSTTLSSATIDYSFDGGAYTSYSWSGSLGSGNTVTVSLPNTTITSGNHTFDVSTTSPNGNTDVDNSNDAATQISFSTATNDITIAITTDQYGSETTWAIVDGLGVTVTNGGPYTDGGAPGEFPQPDENVCLADGCYDFIIYDSFGDGMNGATYGYGTYSVTDASANTLASGGAFTSSETTNFCVPYSVSPPTADFVASATSIPVNSTIIYTDLSTGTPAPTLWSWDFAGGTPGTSVTQNPLVTYNTVGLYATTLTADNGNGSDTEIKTDYIDVYNATGGSCDTIYNLTQPEATSVTYYSLGTNGYLPGHSGYGFYEYADMMNTATQGAVQKLVFPVFRADAGGAGSSVTFKVWDDNGGVPGNELTSETVLLSNLNAGAYNTVEFTNTPIVNGDFYVGVELNYGVGDTVIFGLAPDRSPGTNNTAWINYQGAWNSVDGLFGIVTSFDFEAYLSDGAGVPSFTLSTNEFCVGDSVFVDASGSYNVADFYWDLDGDFALDVAGESMWVPYYAGGSFDIKLYSVGGCKFDSTASQNIYVNDITYGGSYGDISCNGMGDGFVTVTPSGDGTSYTYQWSDGVNNTEYATGLDAGVHTFTITDNNSCEATGSVTISEPDALALSLSATDATANGASDGTATANVLGGTTAYSYSWTSGDNTSNPTNLGAGVHCVTVTDAMLCSVTGCVTVNEPLAPLSATVSSTNETCDALDGTASVSVSGGTGTYTYSWNDGGSQSGSTATGLANGTYMVTINDGSSSIVENVTVSQDNGTITASATATDKVCAAPGSATVTASNGTGGYTYSWSNGGNTDIISNLAAGDYTVTVTDGNGCIANTSVTVGNNSGTLAATISMTAENCTAADGTVTVNATGGTPTYSYLWSNSATTSSLSNLSAGNYDVTVSDVNSCEVYQSITVTQDNGTMTAVATGTEQICTTLGSATVTASNGNGGYSYSWSNGGNTDIISSLAAGDYFVTVTDGNGCTTNTSVTVGNNAGTLSATTSSTVENCSAADGTATVNASNGTPGYTYLWSDSQTSATANNLTAGNYSVSITDVNGCQVIETVTVTRDNGSITASATATDKVCATPGSATVTASNGTGGYSYSWSNGGNTDIISSLAAGDYFVTVTDGNGCMANTSVTVGNDSGTLNANIATTDEVCGNGLGSVSVTATGGNPSYSYAWSNAAGNVSTQSNLSAGVYTVTVVDANSCDVILSTTVSNDSGTLSASLSCSGTSGAGSSDGNSTVTATGGDGSYTYNWSANAGGATGTTASGLGAGTYSITVTDGNGCESIATCDVTDGIVCNLQTTMFSNPTTCGTSTGDANVIASNGTGPYQYTWDDSNSQTTQTAANLGVGTYTVTVIDANSCSVTDVVTVGVTGGPSAIVTTTDDCGTGNGTATLQTVGGVSPYTYNWSNGQNSITATGLSSGTSYNVTITDQTGCIGTASTSVSVGSLTLNFTNLASCGSGNTGSSTVDASGGSGAYNYAWSTGGATQTITGLAVGGYSVTVDDGQGCEASSSTSIVQGQDINVGTIMSAQTCGTANGTATVNTISGGNSPYTFQWSDPASQTGQQAVNLISGQYYVTVTDASGCKGTDGVTVFNTGNLNVAGIATTNEFCNGDCTGNAILSGVSGGSPGYTYQWSDPMAQTDVKAVDLCAGVYTVTVSDAMNCKFIASTTITSPNPISITETVVHETCEQSNASISLGVTGGVTTAGAYTYNWSNGNITSAMSGLSQGNYTITVADSRNCEETTAISLVNNGNLTGEINFTDTTICQGSSVTITASGGFTFDWVTTGETTESIVVNTSNTYRCYVGNGLCVDTVSAVVNVYGVPTISASSNTNNICPGHEAILTATGALNYEWDNGSTTASIFVYPVDETVYTVTGYDYEACGTATATVTVTPDASGTSAIATADQGITTAGTTVNFDGSQSNADTFEWDFDGDGIADATTATASYTFNQNGIYPVVLTTTLSTSSCIGTDTVYINVGNVGIDQLNIEQLVSVYPNPSNGKVTIEFKADFEDAVMLSIHNPIGEVIYTENNLMNKTTLDINAYPTGVYFIRLTSGTSTITKKINLVK